MPYALPVPAAICEEKLPPLAPVGGDGPLSACHFAHELSLKGEDALLGET